MNFTQTRHAQEIQMIYKIEVTQECIDKGEARNGLSCPVAIALINQGFIHVTVSPFWVIGKHKITDLKHFQVHTPLVVLKFMNEFDTNKPVKPFTFEIDV